ncbi:hypothetical protein F2Q68_00019554 [Brassica cretica]|uniref:Uncharacterized protein n=1 Tax=Brassica cretica TaxID=69181 RepID=A0A8S9FSD1_BRACR|nr:hypothetical protein F2Q68_00019554 [Brassica cretica]
MVRQWFIGKGSIRRLIERSPVFPRVGGTRLIEFTGAVIVSTLVAGVREIEFSISQRRGSLFTTTRVDGFFSLSSVYVLSRSRVSVVVSLATRVEVGGSSFVILRSLVVIDVVFLVDGLPSIVFARLGFQDLVFGGLNSMFFFHSSRMAPRASHHHWEKTHLRALVFLTVFFCEIICSRMAPRFVDLILSLFISLLSHLIAPFIADHVSGGYFFRHFCYSRCAELVFCTFGFFYSEFCGSSLSWALCMYLFSL